MNGVRGKPHKAVRPGDELEITLEDGRRRTLTVAALCESSIPRAQARELYEDRTPPPTPEQVEARRLERMLRPQSQGRPDSRDRRALRRLKGR